MKYQKNLENSRETRLSQVTGASKTTSWLSLGKNNLNQYIKDYIMVVIFKRNKQKQMTVNQHIKNYIIVILIRNKQKQMTVSQYIKNYFMIIFKRNKQKEMTENQLYNLSMEGIFKMV